MNDMMKFPNTVEEFMEKYKIVDTEQIYTNGAELVPIFRMKQWFDYIEGTPSAGKNDELVNDDTISRQAAINALVKQTHLTWEHLKTMYPMLNVFEKLPSAERHGRWIDLHCSVCGKVGWMDEDNYCPNCGAKMDEVSE